MNFPGTVEVFGVPATLEIRGHLFAKKNQRGNDGRHGGRTFITTEDAAALDWVILQARHQWAGRPPLRNPAVSVRWYVGARNRDRDGCWTTLLDCLQKAKVIVNDNMAQLGGPEFHEPVESVAAAEERVVITLWSEWRPGGPR